MLWVGLGVGFFVLVLIGAVVKPPTTPQRTALHPAPSLTIPTTAETTPTEPSEEPTEERTEQPVADEPTKAATQAPAEQPTEQPAERPTEQAAKQAAKPPAAGKAVLPDVVGMNLQAAQDTMQAAGFYVLDDQDDTGQHRLQVFDRNWVVTRQEPAAGTKVPTDTLVVLWAKKYGE
ncbi:PASTA domain-containing protein [Microbispora siamensis]|uniref:PASTA domain-containing protein n=1 Tax=Microbispora siamensis TaxID=564413 RepID=UPI00194F335F|nr:PASTA domain-containing protein [Microbispora siamensis]